MAHRKNDADKVLGAYLRQKRESANMTQQYIADLLGVSKMAVSNWESGNRAIYATTLIKYCSIIGLNPNDLVKEIKLSDK